MRNAPMKNQSKHEDLAPSKSDDLADGKQSGLTYMSNDNANDDVTYLLFYTSTKVIRQVTKKTFAKLEAKCFVLRDDVKVKVIGKQLPWKSVKQLLTAYKSVLFGKNKREFLDVFKDAYNNLGEMNNLFRIVKTWMTQFSDTIAHVHKNIDYSMFIDLALIVLRLQNIDRFTVIDITSIILSLYNLHSKCNKLNDSFKSWKCESGPDPLMLSLISFALPSQFNEILKRMSTFTYSKLCDEPGIFYNFIDTIFEAVEYIINLLPIDGSYKDTMKQMLQCLSFGKHYRLLRQAKDMCMKWKNAPAASVDPSFRNQVKDMHKDLNDNEALKELKRRSATVSSTFESFDRLHKCVLAYEAPDRVEPSCFIFEGPPGVFKSVLMNMVIKCCNKTTYAHHIKPMNDGKDFYDSYNGEEIFVMDDLGQQGISQWRSIINMVSNLKLPLDCAALNLKDTKFFNSETIMVTTNNFMNIHGLLRNDGIDNVEALHRRGYVFDFSKITRKGDKLNGFLQFKSYDMKLKNFINSFPEDVSNFMRDHNIEIDVKLPVTGLPLGKIASWILKIVRVFSEVKKQHKTSTDLSESEIKTISEDADIFVNAESFVDSLKSFCPIIMETLTHFCNEISKKIVKMTFRANVMDFMSVGISALYVLGTGLLVYNAIKFLMPVKSVSQVFKSLSIKNGKTPSTPVDAVRNATYDMDVHSGDGVFRVCGIVSGHCIVSVAHAFSAGEGHITIYKDRDAKHVLVDHAAYKVVHKDDTADVVVLTLPLNFPTPFKNLSKFFQSNSVSSSIYTQVDRTPQVQSYAKELWYVTCAGVVYLPMFIKVSKSNVYYSFDGTDSGPINVVRTSGHDTDQGNPGITVGVSAPGMCGSSIVHERGLVLGLHVAGDGTDGTAVIWSHSVRNKIHQILKADNKYKIEVDISPKVLDDVSGIKLQANAHIQTPKQTNFVPSPLYGSFPITREPADLSKYGPHTVKDIEKKSFKLVSDIPQDELEFAKKVIDTYICDFDDIDERAVVSGNKSLAGLNKDSSNGFGCEKDKSYYIDFENGRLTDEGRAIVSRVEDNFESGDLEMKDLVWYSTLKDETRGLEKEGKPRSFRVSPLPIQILTKKYFGNMVSKIIEHKTFSGIMIGVNPFTEWPQMYNNLKSCSGVWAGDIGNYDGNMLPQVQHLVSKCIMDKYKGKHKNAAAFLLQNLSTTLVAINDDMMLTTHSLPSGSFLTAIFNSIVNKAYTAMWFYRNVPVEKRTVSSFQHEIVDYVYGDDKLNGVRTGVFPDLHAVSMEKFFRSIGMTFTDASKQPIKDKFQKLHEVSFLKRSFVYHRELGKIVCPLDKRTLYSGLSWLDSSKDGLVVMVDKVNNFQREMYLHEDTFEEDVDKLEQSCLERGVCFNRLPRYYLFSLFKYHPDECQELSWGGSKYM
jgi:hypothetical protein